MAASPYFACAYFDQAYFDTDCAPAGGHVAKGRVRLARVEPPKAVEREDEEGLLMVRLL